MTARYLPGRECRAVHLFPNRSSVGVPESDFLNRSALAEPAKSLPSQTGAETEFAPRVSSPKIWVKISRRGEGVSRCACIP